MSRAQAESVIKNIITEIAQECTHRGQVVSETLVAFMVKAVVLDPDNGFNVDRTLTKDDVQKLIKICIDRLMETDSPSLNTVKMQVYFDMNYTSRSDFLSEHRRVLESRLHLVVREITDSRAITKEDLESLYKKIVSCVLLRSGLGSPTDISVVREVTAALQSVFPVTEIGTFISLSKKDKERQLIELSLITTGIRLFNKDCGKGGEGIDNLPAILSEAVPATIQNIQNEINKVSQLAYTYAAILENSHVIKELSTEVQWEDMKDAQVNARQQETFISILLHDISNCREQIESLEEQYQSRMDVLKETVASKTAVPTAQVYPQFINIANVWTGFQDEMVLVSVLSNIFSGLQQFSQFHRAVFPDELLDSLCADIDVKSDEERLNENSGEENMLKHARITNKAVEILYPESTKNFDQLPLQYRGLCGYIAVTYDRLLLPGNPELGILLYKDNYYSFSSPEAAYSFAEDPDHYIQCIADKAKKSPELIQLMELHKQFAAITPYSQGGGKMIEAPIRKSDAGTQTDTHFMESNIVKTYEWNEWELRRKAIKLANLRKKITHSVQTNLSNYLRDNSTQVYLPKDAGTQSKRDGYSNVPKPSTYIAGLRGCNSTRTKMNKVDLTIDIDQS